MTSYKSQAKRIPNYFPSSFSEKKKKKNKRGERDKEASTTHPRGVDFYGAGQKCCQSGPRVISSYLGEPLDFIREERLEALGPHRELCRRGSGTLSERLGPEALVHLLSLGYSLSNKVTLLCPQQFISRFTSLLGP